MIGIKNVFSSLRKAFLPPGVKDEQEFFEVWLSPSLAPWAYRPEHVDGPFRLIRTDLGTEIDYAVYAWDESSNLDRLLAELVRSNLPRRFEICTILDARAQIVCGWRYPDPNGAVWAGCQYAFERLAVLHNSVDAALWEVSAREYRERAWKEQYGERF